MEKLNAKNQKLTDIPAVVRRTGLLAVGDRVAAGVSGGADSVCLLLVLKELAVEIGFSLSVVHVEHGIRGEQSRADAAFVRRLCEKLGVAFVLKEVDVRASVSTHVSEEEAARNLRRDALCEAAEALYGKVPVKVALAHNADDQAETVLLHLIRGTGVKGLCGMRTQTVLNNEISIIRPLLTVSRAGIEEWLAVQGQEYRTDATNLEDIYMRNRIRHRILPLLSEMNTQAVTHIGRTAQALQEIEDGLSRKADIAANEAIIELRLNRIIAAAYPPETQNRIIKAWIYKRNHTVRNTSSAHIGAVRALLEAPNGTRADIPGAYRVRVDGDYLIWEEKTGRNAPNGRTG